MIALLLVSFGAAGLSGFSNEAMGIWKAYFFEPLLVFILILNVFRGRMEKIIWPLAGSALIVSMLAIFQKFTGLFIDNPLWAAENTRRVVSFFGYPNAVGLYLGPIILLLVGFFMQILFKQIPNSKSQITSKFQILNLKSQALSLVFIVITIILSLLSAYFARSEGALLGITVALVFFGLSAGKGLRVASISVLAALAIMLIISAPARSYVINKITLNDFSGQVRKLQWLETWQMLKSGYLFFGSGLANYQAAIKPYHQEGFYYNSDNDPDFHRKLIIFDNAYRRKYWQPLEIYLYPHNIFLNFWTELGLAGMVLFAWIIAKYFYLGISNCGLVIIKGENKFLNLGLLGSMIVLVIHGLVDAPYFKNDLAVLFWLLIAMMSLSKIDNKNKKMIDIKTVWH
jgi:O-antigen ligase